MIVVSNSSPLIALARIHRLDLLASLYKPIYVPVEVHQEVVVAGQGLPGAEEVRQAGWIEVAAPQGVPDPALALACRDLGAGERGALALASSMKADLRSPLRSSALQKSSMKVAKCLARCCVAARFGFAFE